jgi:hypothetical protein
MMPPFAAASSKEKTGFRKYIPGPMNSPRTMKEHAGSAFDAGEHE